MTAIATILTVLVALLHLYFLVLEMFLWTRPTGMRVFRLSPEFAQRSKALAMNQGLYNGFLAAGLTWGVLLGGGQAVTLFFLACVVVAGVFGGATVSRRIFFVQALPAIVAAGFWSMA